MTLWGGDASSTPPPTTLVDCDLLGAPNVELRFGYDWEGRRVSKVVSNKVGGVWQLQSSRKFLHDGWNLVAELDGSNVLQRTHVWGLDANGTMQGAGGVGGLLATIIHTGTNAGVYFPAYDGNHNVVAYISAATGGMVAQYEYGPFGELLRATGPLAKDFTFLFSTKYYDWETGLYYYGYRYYNPTTGRWLSRDPIGEQGGNNLYNFAANDPLDYIDTDGRFTGTKCSVCGQWYQGYHKCPRLPPPPHDPVGFALCMRNVNPEGLGEYLLLIGFRILHPQTPTDHAYLHYKHCDKCERVGWGIGGTKPGAPPIQENKFNPTDCKPCKRTASLLQYGALGRKGTEATDSEILDCISEVPTSKPYKPTGKGQYNCLDWAKEAASKCGLDCN